MDNGESGEIHQFAGLSRDHIEERLGASNHFRGRVAEMCKAEVTTEDAVKGDKAVEQLIENTVMQLRGIIGTREDSPVLPWLVEHAGSIRSKCQKGRDVRTPFEGLHGNKPSPQFVLFGEKVLARHTSTEPVNRINSRFQFGIWPGMRNNSAECVIGNVGGVFRAIRVSV